MLNSSKTDNGTKELSCDEGIPGDNRNTSSYRRHRFIAQNFVLIRLDSDIDESDDDFV